MQQAGQGILAVGELTVKDYEQKLKIFCPYLAARAEKIKAFYDRRDILDMLEPEQDIIECDCGCGIMVNIATLVHAYGDRQLQRAFMGRKEYELASEAR